MTEPLHRQGRLIVNGVELQADLSGALIWPARRLAVVADLHFEKATAFAARGQYLPPYDTPATLDKLEDVIARGRVERVICLGDSFHDVDTALLLAEARFDLLGTTPNSSANAGDNQTTADQTEADEALLNLETELIYTEQSI
jgi:hypothetical protein